MMTAHALDTLSFAPMQESDLDDVMAVETTVYPYPWSRKNFLDSLASGYEAWLLRDDDGALVGYYLAMWAVDEVHLLNVAVAANRQREGIGRYLLDKLADSARRRGIGSILLEVRPSNERALKIYMDYGYRIIGRRRGYYPAAGGREDAIVMRYVL